MKVLLSMFVLLSVVCSVAQAELIEKKVNIPFKILDKDYSFELIAIYDSELSLHDSTAILVFHGTGGALPRSAAEEYARQGYVGVAIHYFDYNPNYTPGKRPYTLINVPLEGFKAAIQWVSELSNNTGKVIIEGRSRGGSLVLLLGQLYSDMIAGIISEVPSIYVWGDRATGNWSPRLPIESLPIGPNEGPSWTLNGQGVPFIPFYKFLQEISEEVEYEGLPLFSYEVGFTKATNKAIEMGIADQARIRVEDIKVPILVTGGLRDSVWASGEAAQSIKKYREKSIYSDKDIYLIEDAGHMWSSEETFFKFPDGGYNQIVNQKVCQNIEKIKYISHRNSILKICSESSELDLSTGVYFAAPEWGRMNYGNGVNKNALLKLKNAKALFLNSISL